MKRLVLALTAGVIVAAAVYGVLYGLAKPDDAATAHAEGISTYRHAKTAWNFVMYFTGAAFIITFLAARAIANKVADARYARSLVPEAKQIR
jgi:hypothetical protein